jgi:3-hydroxyisobutyrate dehydrogenase-like beta-hydroxyacid dehydrogenase
MTEGTGQVGVVGLGAIGEHLARHLAGLTGGICVHDIRDEPVRRLVSAIGAEPADSLAELAGRCGVVVLSLPNTAIVEEVVLGESGLHEGLAPGSLVIDCSSISPSASRAIHDDLAARGVEFVDAPVAGGVEGARPGTLTVMVGGSEAGAARAEPYLRAFADRVRVMGGPGAGQTMKTVNNMIGNMAFTVTNEALTLGLQAGLDLEAMLEVINSGPAWNNATLVRFPDHIVTGKYSAGMKIGLVNKDLDICADLASELNVPLFFSRVGHQYWKHAVSRGLAEADTTRIFPAMYELLTGHHYVPPGGEEP